MKDNRIHIRGNKEGINAIIDIEKFNTFDEVINILVKTLSVGKGFYKNSIVKITSNFKNVTESDIAKLKDELFEKVYVRDCIFEDISVKKKKEDTKIFNGINEGKTKFVNKTVRGGQCISYPGNIVIIGDINSGAEVEANGNIVVLGRVRGQVRAGVSGNKKAIIAAFLLQPEILQIGDLVTISPDDEIKPSYPEIAKIKEGSIVVEPYLPNKYIYSSWRD